MEAFHPPTSLKGTPAVVLVFYEVMLLIKLSAVLWWSFVKAGVKWMFMTLSFLLYVACLSPGFLRVAYEYTKSKSIIKNIRYGERPRNLLDIFLCEPIDKEQLQDVVIEGEKKAEEEKDPVSRQPAGKPVAVFVSGGAWILGYKGWGALFAKTLSRCGIIVVTPDYRNFPQGGASDMVVDISQAMKWVFENISLYGGDPERIFLIAQSAGAHISALALLRQAMKQVNQPASSLARGFLSRSSRDEEEEKEDVNGEEQDSPLERWRTNSFLMTNKRKRDHLTRWPSGRLRAFVGISGPYDILSLEDRFESRGFYKSVVRGIMEHDVLEHSPTSLLLRMFQMEVKEAEREREREKAWAATAMEGEESDPPSLDSSASEGCSEGTESETEREEKMRKLGAMFPPMYLVHGECDRSCPPNITTEFAAVLRRMGVSVREKYYKEKAHTDSVVEDPIRGNDILVRDIVALIVGSEKARQFQRDGEIAAGMKEHLWFGDEDVTALFTAEQKMVLMQAKPLIPHFLIDTARFFNPF